MTELQMTAAAPAEVSTESRTIRGLAVPYGPAGTTSQGLLTFAAGALRWTDPRRVKLLLEHDQHQVAGYATELTETPAGLHATFTVPPGELGDRALHEAAHGLRDALSVGVQLDDAVMTRLRRAQASGGAAVAGAGALREVSLAAVPAFDDARVDSVAATAGRLVVSAWTDPPPAPEGTPPVTITADAPPAPDTAEQATAAAAIDAAPATALPAVPQSAVPAPAPAPLAVAGAATVTSAPATYAFAGGSDSLVRDAYMARMEGDPAAAGRLSRFNAELADGNPSSVMALAAVMVRPGDATDPIGPFVPQGYRPDMLVRVIDAGRPFASRLARIPLSNATPFLLPVEGEFTGVGLHVEGTAHVPEGTLGVGDETVRPRAVSGAFRVSRELVDSSNPAIDRVALSAMLRDYRRFSETRIVAALTAADATATAGVDSIAALRGELLDFMPDDDVPASFVALGRDATRALIVDDADTTGRPMLPAVGPSNAPGTLRAGYRATVDNVELFRSSRLPAAEGLIVQADDVLFAESNVAQFRFDEVEGPGVVKLALWAYIAAAVLRVTGVRRFTTASA